MLLDDDVEPELIVSDLVTPNCDTPPPTPATLPIPTPGHGAKYIYVGNDALQSYATLAFTDIQPALDKAQPGDVVLVDDGYYRGSKNRNLEFWRPDISTAASSEDVTLQSINGPSRCFIDIEGKKARGFIFRGEQVRRSTSVVGFTIMNARASSGAGILCIGDTEVSPGEWQGSPIIRNCVITACKASKKGGGLYCAKGAAPVVDGCVFHRNTAGSRGGAVAVDGAELIYLPFPQFTNAVVTCNSAGAYGGGVWCGDGSRMEFSGGEITYNDSRRHGGGIACETSTKWLKKLGKQRPEYDNKGVYLSRVTRGRTHGTFTGKAAAPVVIANNRAKKDGGGIWSVESVPFLTYCHVVNNLAGRDGGGALLDAAYLDPMQGALVPADSDELDDSQRDAFGRIGVPKVGPPQFRRCRVEGNATGQHDVGGGLYIKGRSWVFFSHGFIVGNLAGDGGGVAVGNKAIAYLNNSVINNNKATLSGKKSVGIGGGGLAESGGNITATFCTIADNDARVSGGGLYVAGVVGLSSTIVEGNSALADSAIGGTKGGSWYAQYCNMRESAGISQVMQVMASSTKCNTFVDPRFAAAVGGIRYVLDFDPARAEDYPCVDRGGPYKRADLPWPDDISDGGVRRVVKRSESRTLLWFRGCDYPYPSIEEVCRDIGAYEVK